MSAEVMATIIGTAFTVITLALTIYFTNRNTQKILRRHESILKGHGKILERIAHAIHNIAHLIEKVASHSEVEFELQGIKIAENVDNEEEAKKLGEVIKYNRNSSLPTTDCVKGA